MTIQVPVKAGDLFLLTQLDDENASKLGDRKLSLGSHGYAQMWNEEHVMLVHRWVMGAYVGDGRMVDHQNGDTLDNQKLNLRFVTPAESSANRKVNGKSGIRGVHQLPSGRWQVKVQLYEKRYCLGTYDTREEAAEIGHQWRLENMPGYTGDCGEYDMDAIGGFRDRRTGAERKERREYIGKIRGWAAGEHGIALNERGRIPKALVAAYEAAH